MIEITALSKRFGPILAVDNVTFSVPRGEVLGFLGPNGAGKSTTMKMVAGFLRPSSGTANVGGSDVRKDPLGVKRKLGYLPEGAPAYPDMTPASFLKFVAGVRGITGKDRRDRIREVASRVHLEGVMQQPIETLSKGYKRRVGLAQALLHDPDVLILDEPTDGLDPNQKHEVRELIREMGRSKAIILSTHILEEVEAVCTRAIVIAKGKVLADGTPNELLARSRFHNAVSVRAKGESAKVLGQLRKLPSVASVTEDATDNGQVHCTVFPKKGEPVIGEVAACLQSLEVRVDELRAHEGRLDDVFRDITQSKETSA